MKKNYMGLYCFLKQGIQEEKEVGRGGVDEVIVKIIQLEVFVRFLSGCVRLGFKKDVQVRVIDLGWLGCQQLLR